MSSGKWWPFCLSLNMLTQKFRKWLKFTEEEIKNIHISHSMMTADDLAMQALRGISSNGMDIICPEYPCPSTRWFMEQYGMSYVSTHHVMFIYT